MASALEILASDSGSLARAGTLRTAHGDIRTPAFVPLATKASVRGLLPAEVSELGYDIVLGNTFHLHLNPGDERIAALGGLHEFMRWDGPIITDSGGFQVFSMGHGTVADEIKGRAPTGPDRAGKVLGIEEDGVRYRSYVDGSTRFMGPEDSMRIQANLGSDIALVFDECTPFNVEREYTARSTERSHRWLDRCLSWHAENGPADQLVYGIVQGGVYEDLRRDSTEQIAARACDGIAIGGSLGEHKEQMYEVVGWATDTLAKAGDIRPRHLLGIGEVDDLIRGVEMGIDTFDCVMPTRLGRHGVALVPDPEHRWRVDLTTAKWSDSDEPLMEGCPCPACAVGYSRGYLRYMTKARELTAMRLLTVHNLAFVARVVERLRRAILAGDLATVAAELRAGGAP
ncbi:MAG: tRNA guanosine(34) transglycosylase Tgt [Solirubrobacteraceae bacterium]|nr:tRNA guanosine(34) transglycosylase Tgt [Solirubrobacteraceae bacterium]